MPPNLKNAVEEPEGSWPDRHGASNSFIDLDISLDLTPSKDYGRRSSSSHRTKPKETRNGGAWGEANELQSNLRIEVGDRSFHLHKFPLISKSGKLNRLVFELRDPGKDRISLHDVPGGADVFETAVRFLYGRSSVAVTSGNVAALRCAAEFLEMNDSLGEGSLVAKTEHYLNLVVVGSWRDSIAVLRSCSGLKPWAEELEIVRRCRESVAWKASTDPHGLRWSYPKPSNARNIWWFDDVCSLHIDTFTRVINAVIAKGMDHTTVAAVVTQYAEKWLNLTHHDSKNKQNPGFSGDGAQTRNRAILHEVVNLLPSQPDSVSSKFLLKLLRAACAVNAGSMCKTDLAKRIGAHLEKVAVDELLIPAASDAMYDIDVVHQIVECYLQEQSSAGSPPSSPTSVSTVTTSSSSDRSVSGSSASGSSVTGTSDSRRSSISRSTVSGSGTSISRTASSMSESSRSDESASTGTTSSSDEGSAKPGSRFEKAKFFSMEEPMRRPQLPPTSSNLKVAHLLESFLEAVAKDSSIPLGKFVALAELFVDLPRVSDDCVYQAIDTFLRSHASLNDQERRRLCKVMDIQALSVNACMHAASNERLPLRVVVQLLFTEQVKIRNAVAGTAAVSGKGVAASFSSSNSRHTYSNSSSSDPLSSSTSGTDTPTTSVSRATTSSSSSAYRVASSLMPGGLSAKDTLRSALSEIRLLRTAVQEIETMKARLSFMDVLQHEMENINRKFMDLAHDYTGMTHQVEELTKAAKHKGGWTSGWKKMAKPFQGKEHPDLQKGFNHGVMSEKHLKAVGDTMNILHPTDVPLLQNPSKLSGQAAAAAKAAAPEAPKRVVAAASRIPEAKVETAVKMIVEPAPKPEPAIVANASENAPVKVTGASEPSSLKLANGALEHNHGNANGYQAPRPSFSRDQPPRPSVSKEQPARHKDEPGRRSVSEKNHTSHHQHDHKYGGAHQPRGQRHHGGDSDTVSVSSHYSYSSAHSNPRLRHQDTSSSHRSEDRSHRSSSHDHGLGHKSSHHQPRRGSRSRSPDVHHRRIHHSPDHHRQSHHSKDPPRASSATKHESDHHSDHRHHSRDPPRASSASKHESDHHSDHRHHSRDPPRASSATRHGSDHHTDHHHHSRDPPRASSAGNHHKHGSDHHSGHHSKPHHRSHHKHHHRKEYDSASSYSSDSDSGKATWPRRHS